MMHHQPVLGAAHEEVGRRRLRRIEARLVKYRDVLQTAYPGDIAEDAYPDLGRRGAHPLTALEDHLPALAHTRPADDHLPPWMHTAHPVFVRPDLFHAFEDAGFQGAIKRRVGLLDQHFDVAAHLPRKPIAKAHKRQAHPDTIWRGPPNAQV